MSRRADVVSGSHQVVGRGPGFASDVGPASTVERSSVTVEAWPLQSRLVLGALPSAVPSARLHARLVVNEWGLGALAETVELIVSELVTNAITASKRLTGSWYRGRWSPGTPPVRLWLQSERQRVLVQVWDGNDRSPSRQEPGADEEHGRGLLLVEALCAEWGAYKPEQSSGKVVWATVHHQL